MVGSSHVRQISGSNKLCSLVDQRNMYQPSEKKMEDFRQTLTRFNEMLEKKKLFSSLGIPVRNPEDFDIDYVLTIAERISERNHKSDELNTCKRFARHICHKAVKNKNVLSGLIGLAPTDAYGSLISGGFTIVLAVSATRPRKARNVESKALLPADAFL